MITQIIQNKKFNSDENISFHALYQRTDQFLKKNFNVLRKAIYLGQAIPENALNLCFKFLKEIINIRKFKNYDIDNIINCDETPIYLDAPSSLTLAEKGKKILTIKLYGKETIRIICLISIKGDSIKLMRLFIFKGRHNENICQKFQYFKIFKDKKLYITTKENSWMTSEIFLEYIDNVLINDSKNKKTFNYESLTLHDIPKVLDKLEKQRIDAIFIPERMTSILLPLNSCANFPFKKKFLN